MQSSKDAIIALATKVTLVQCQSFLVILAWKLVQPISTVALLHCRLHTWLHVLVSLLWLQTKG
eukprot:COSAG02_NODE_17387_length_1007_cov_2.034141_1_plen_63_part_00